MRPRETKPPKAVKPCNNQTALRCGSKQNLMKTSILFIPILCLLILACEQQSVDTEPNLDTTLSQISRIEYTNTETGGIAVTEYTYENGLLHTETNPWGWTEYFYEDDVLIRKVNWNDGSVGNTVLYAYEPGKLEMTINHPPEDGLQKASIFEYLQISDSQMRINTYQETNGQREFNGYLICQLVDGNVVLEEGFDRRGGRTVLHTEKSFGETLNPFAQWVGHPQIVDKQLAIGKEEFANREFWVGTYKEVKEVNAENLPLKVREIRISPADTVERTINYFYNN